MAQSVEQLTRNEQVVGSIPTLGSRSEDIFTTVQHGKERP